MKVQPTCAERLEAHYESAIEDVIRLVAADQNPDGTEVHRYGGGAMAESHYCEACAPDPIPCPACVASEECGIGGTLGDGCHPMCSGYEVEPWDDWDESPRPAQCDTCGADYPDEDGGVIDLGNLNEYGLCFDYVEPDEGPAYFAWVLSTGGPASEFRFHCGPSFRLHCIEYVFSDWFDSAYRQVSRNTQAWESLETFWNMLEECEVLASKVRESR
jgi:hypothetical protein